MGRRWAAAMAEVAATGGSCLSGRVAMVVMVTGHLVVRETEICGVLRVLICLVTSLAQDYRVSLC